MDPLYALCPRGVSQDQKLLDTIGGEIGLLDQDACITLMCRRDGIVNLQAYNFVAEWPNTAQVSGPHYSKLLLKVLLKCACKENSKIHVDTVLY